MRDCYLYYATRIAQCVCVCCVRDFNTLSEARTLSPRLSALYFLRLVDYALCILHAYARVLLLRHVIDFRDNAVY